MSRPRKCCRIADEPLATVFKPAGVPGRDLEAVRMGLDELEALRLADLEGLYHDAAAERMGVSRPTFGRLIAAARAKVAQALIEGRMLVLQGGAVVVDHSRRFDCLDCGEAFEVERGTGGAPACPQCHGTNVRRAEADRGHGRWRRRGWRHGSGGGCGWRSQRMAGAVRTEVYTTDEASNRESEK